MKSNRRVAAPPPKPTNIFDGDCHFCTLWIKRWQQTTGDAVEYVPFQDPRVAQNFPELPREQLDTAVHLVEPNGDVFMGAEAVLRALATNPDARSAITGCERWPRFAKCVESVYRFVAGHRPFFSWLTRIGWGQHVERPTHFLTRWIFLRSLGVIYLIAFLSLWSQLSGLIGRHGILPAAQLMEAGHRYHAQGHGVWDCFQLLPTLCWFSASDGFLNFLCAAGAASSALLVIGG